MESSRIKLLVLLIYISITVLTLINPIYPDFQLLQHSATILYLSWMGIELKQNRFSVKFFVWTALFMTLHSIGARWIYSNVPYDQWCNNLFGFSLSEIFEWDRNMFDRLVHFCYGFLLYYPVKEVYIVWLKYSNRQARHITLLFIMASSTVYELFEWALTLTAPAHQAEGYNGQQGDVWDAQKDMFLATFGALILYLGDLLVNKKSTDLSA